jgi:hypothetical protein
MFCVLDQPNPLESSGAFFPPATKNAPYHDMRERERTQETEIFEEGNPIKLKLL